VSEWRDLGEDYLYFGVRKGETLILGIVLQWTGIGCG